MHNNKKYLQINQYHQMLNLWLKRKWLMYNLQLVKHFRFDLILDDQNCFVFVYQK